jgi:DNA-binding HxlR family transcriptional regulator
MENKFRCNCPATSALDLIGDKWTLVIIKQMLLERKKTFTDFAESDEAIATNILSSRLKMLEEFKIISKEKLPHNKKTNIYLLTDKGLGLSRTIVEMILWSNENIKEFNPTMVSTDNGLLKIILKDTQKASTLIVKDYQANILESH